MVATSRVQEIFTDAKGMHAKALERLAVGDIRDAAEKAWRATKRATDALILACTGEKPGPTGMTSDLLDQLARQHDESNSLVGRYYSRISQLHGSCFYVGHCNDQTEHRIRETALYIEDAERLANY